MTPPNAQGKLTSSPLYLVGVGMRRKNFWIVDVDVYMAGFLLSKPAEQRARKWRTAEQEARISLSDVLFDFNDSKANGTAKAMVSLKFVRSVTTAQVVEGFNDAFHDLDPAEVGRFKEALNTSVGLKGVQKGEEVAFIFMNGGGLCITVHGQVQQLVQSPLVEKRLLAVYMDPKYTVSKELMDSTLQNLAAETEVNR
jgi:hypothetical protein